jgi:NADH dehydrogenase FAD-containing subunit
MAHRCRTIICRGVVLRRRRVAEPSTIAPGAVIVVRDLLIPGHPDVGDAAEVRTKRETGAGRRPAAKQMGVYVGRLIAARVAGIRRPSLSPPGRPRDHRAASGGGKFGRLQL